MAIAKVHLVLRGMAFCDFQNRDGGRIAAHSVSEFNAFPKNEQCKECAKKLAKIQAARK